MSKKARRRPSWKKENNPFFIQLINEETNKVFCRVRVKDKQTRDNFKWIINTYGMEYAQASLEEYLIEECNRILGEE